MRNRFKTSEQNSHFKTEQNKIFKSNIISKCTCIGTVLFLLLSSVCSAIAQDQAPNRGFTPGNSYSLGDFEVINTTNGNVAIRFPLGNLPAGRNGLSAGAYLTYNSKLYDSETKYYRNEAYECEYIEGGGANGGDLLVCPYYTKQFLKMSDEGGWRLTSGYQLKLEDRRAQYVNVPQSQQPQCRDIYGGVEEGYNTMTYVYKLHVVFPDGSQHEMIPYGHTDFEQDRYFKVRYDGLVENCGGSTYYTGSPMTYYSVDGTFVRLEFSYDGDSDPNNNTWTLHFPDGTKYENSTGKIYDRNGNYIDFDPGQISDQFGRSIVSGHDTQTDEDTFTLKGVGGEDLVWRVKWKEIVVYKQYNAFSENLLGCGATQTCPPDTNPETFAQRIWVVDKITLPSQAGNNLAYTFHYNAPAWTGQMPSQETVGWGELSGITVPSGAESSYTYYLDNETISTTTLFTANVLKNKITSKTLSYDREYDGSTSNVEETWEYDIQPGGAIITAPDGGVTTDTFGDTGSVHWRTGLSLISVAPDGTKVEKIWAQNFPEACTRGYYCEMYAANQYVKTEFVSIKDKDGNYTLTAIKDYNYDKNGNMTQVAEYDFVSYSSVPRDSQGHVTGIPSGITPKRITASGYYAETPDASQATTDSDLYIWRTSPLLKNAPAWSEVRNGSNQAVTRTEMFFDGATSLSQMPTVGNLTMQKSWDSWKGGSYNAYSNPLTSNNSISTSTTYNNYGMPLTTTDARGTITQITYGNITGPNGTVTNLYPTEVKTAYNTSVQKTAQMQYDFYRGAVTLAKDVDNDVSTVTEYDVFGRPKLVKAAYQTSIETRAETIYNDAERRVIVKSDLNSTGDGKLVSIQHYDQLGRVRLTRTLEDPTTQSATNENDGIKVQTRYLYSGNFSYVLSSNPYRAATSSAATNEPTMGWSRSKTNNKGQTIEIETFSGASLPSPLGSNSNSTGVVLTDYDANKTTVTDQSGKRRKSEINALGQLVKVTEDPSVTGYTGLNYETTYTYDTLSNLTQVNQGVQTRTFTYSSLSRLLTATNPESGSMSYTYDAGGNLLTKKDARNIKTSYSYDQLSRVLTRSYELCPQGQSCQSEGTPTVTYTYDDSNVPFGIGKLTKVSSSVSETSYTSFDALGKLLSSKQRTDGTDYTMSYTYNLAGGLVSQTYPSGRVVTNSFDEVGRFANVSSKPNSNVTQRTYANAFTYTPSGAVSSMRFGNGRYESTQFNSRLQPTQIALGTSANNSSLLKLEYSYGTNDNNGNVQSQTITVLGMSHPLVQAYTYDALNRLKSATETSNSTQTWKQTFSFDRFGNRMFDTSNNNTTTLPENFDPDIYNPTLNPANNRMDDEQGYEYDAAGNVTKDATNKRFVYDGENKQTSFGTGGSSTNGGSYFYDGDGKRVKKIVDTETTIFVYNASGQMIAEYTTTAPTNPTISYLTSDTLGSPRINTDQDGQVSARHDYMPFGEEIIGLGNRQSSNGYQDDDIRQKFTQYERDNETGLDFAQARYYSSAHGRFTTVDPLMASARIGSPKTLNRYTYALNNPLRFTDPTGLVAGDSLCEQTGDCSNTEDEQQQQEKKPKDPFDDFEKGSPKPPTSGSPVPARAEIVRPLEGNDEKGRPRSYRNIYRYKETLLIQVKDQYGKPYYAVDTEGNPPYVIEEIKEMPGAVGVDPESKRKTNNADLNSDGQIADEHETGPGPNLEGKTIPDNLKVTRRQIIYVEDPSGKRYDVGHFEYTWTKNTLTIKDYTNGKDKVKTTVIKR